MNRTHRPPLSNFPRRQHGAVLIISLLLLLVMTLIGITAMQSSTLEEKMAGNMHNRNVALQAAEAALRVAEADIEAMVSTAAFDDSGAYYSDLSTVVPTTQEFSDEATWNDAAVTAGDVIQISGSDAVDGVSRQPVYFIQFIGKTEAGGNPSLGMGPGYGGLNTGDTSSLFRVTVRATGRTAGSQVILRTIYGKAF